VVERAVTFTVQNTNRSAFACASDGLTYEVKGHLVGPARALSPKRKRRGVTLYLHGLGLGEWLWHLSRVRSYDYVRRQALAGHVSVAIDRIGYGASGHPPGMDVCIGSQADVAHQIVQQLRSGQYAVDTGTPPAFRRVGLVGHSAAGEIATVEAYSFGDVDALMIVGFAFVNLPRAQTEFGNQRIVCERGGEPAGPGLPGGYALFGDTQGFRRTMFHSAKASVVKAALPLQYRDPCGDNLSLAPAIAAQSARMGRIKAPVLVACGRRDALYSPFGCEEQLKRYTGARNRRLLLVPNAGHALPLERTASIFRKRVSRWLRRRGF
jgi:pimeloyl-ACP methyl ester carboxylesterase